jgi:hypothetical protein
VALYDANVSSSLSPSASASDGNSTVQVTMPNGDIYFHRYNYDNYGESNNDCTGWPAGGSNRYGRFWPVLSGERVEYEIAGGRPSNGYLQLMTDAANDGYFVPEQVWDRPDIACFTPAALPAARLLSTGLRANTCVSPSRSTLTISTRLPSLRRSIAAQVQSSALVASALTMRARAQTTEWRSKFSLATERPLRAGPGTLTTARPLAERRFSSGTATARPLRSGAGDNRPDS